MSIYNRTAAVAQNFSRFVEQGRLPESLSTTNLLQSGMSRSELLELFESQVMSRQLDLIARKLKEKSQCYYTIGSSGHEGNAAIAKVFRLKDMAFLHYRSGAFMMQKSKKLPHVPAIYNTLLSLTASKEDPISGGRHKVWGSKELFVPPQTSTIASHLPKAVGLALSIKRAKDLNVESEVPSDSVVLCSFGDASANHSTAQGAINSASWVSYQNIPLPLVFICEDNNTGISVPTPQNWIEQSFSGRAGLNYVYADGLNLFDVYRKSKMAERIARVKKQPVFLHLKTVRLMGHAGSDIENNYRSLSDIEAVEFQDPLLHTARLILENHLLSSEEIVQLYNQIGERIEQVAKYVITRPALDCPKHVMSAITACERPKSLPSKDKTESRKNIFGRDFAKLSTPQHMAKLINWALHDILLQYDNALVFGEDVAQKGGVYHVTDSLYKKFGAKRVFNSLLDEQAILGNAIGLAQNGFLPIPEIQFLAYVHNAEDQIRGEAATLAFFSQGQFVNPMVIRIAGLAYQKGFGGHFHNDNSLSVFRDIPGLIIAVPSNGADAVKMLRTCVEESQKNGRVCVFIEPIALYMTRDLNEEGDKKWSFCYPEVGESVELGEFNILGSGEDFCVITYGNGAYYSAQAQEELKEKHNISCSILDLRWLSPLKEDKILQAIKKFKKILIVEECRKTGSMSEQISTMIVEKSLREHQIGIVSADDSFIPLGQAAASGLPKKTEIIEAALKLMEKQ